MRKITVLLVILLVFAFTAVSAEDRVNLIDENTYIQPDSHAYFEDGILGFTEINAEYLVNFSAPNLTSKYVWEGDIKITDIDTDIGYSGIRFCIGHDESSGNYINLILTRTIGVTANQRGANPVDDLIPLTKDTFPRDLEAGMEFHFEIIREDAHVVLKIDGNTVIDTTLADEHNLFTEDYDLNLGFTACMTTFEVSNLAVYNVSAEPEPSTEPTTNPPTGDSTLSFVFVAFVLLLALIVLKKKSVEG